MTVDFVGAFQALYSDMDPQKSLKYARSFLFDIARIAGRSDSARFVQNMDLDNLQTKIGIPLPLSLLSYSPNKSNQS